MIGRTITDDNGQKFKIVASLGSGSQADVYKATDATGNVVAIKLFRPGNSEMPRAKQLMKLGLPSSLPVAMPRSTISTGALEGYVTDFVEGVLLESLFEAGQLDYFASFKLVAMLWIALAKLHAHGLIHGDVQSQNIMITPSGDVMFIDIDNFVTQRVTIPAPCVGEHFVLAPELRSRLQRGENVAPFISYQSDVYALNVLCYLLLTGEDDTYGAASVDEFNQRRLAGGWNGDRYGKGLSSGAGLPPQMLPLELESLIRQAWSGNPLLRPGAADFARATSNILANGQLIACEQCGMPVFIDSTKTTCPHCRTALPTPVLVRADGSNIVVSGSYLLLGRNDLGGDPSVSAKHAILQREGPLLRVTDRSTYGSWRNRSGSWEQLPKGAPVIVHPGEMLRFGNVKLNVGRV
ncbi:MAG: FHA domain-containing protein [Sulfuricella sp.]|nr:FHA domain-containing protein [Sulfuricella sp.]